MHGHDVAGVAGVVFNLLPQLRDVRINGARQWKIIVAPHGVEQLIAAQNFAPVDAVAVAPLDAGATLFVWLRWRSNYSVKVVQKHTELR
jgi:hypothetical protein